MFDEKDSFKRQRMAREALGERFDEAHDLMDAGDYLAALPLLQEIRILAKDAYPDEGSTPAIEVLIGECYENTGRLPEAEEAYRNSLSLIESHKPEKQEQVFGLLRDRAEQGLKRIN